MSSIRRYLVTILIAILTLTSFMAALQSYRESISRADQLFDDDLKVLAGSLLHPFTSSTQDNSLLSVVQIWQGSELLYRSANAPEHQIEAQLGYSEQNFSGQRWRTYVQISTADLAGGTNASQEPNNTGSTKALINSTKKLLTEKNVAEQNIAQQNIAQQNIKEPSSTTKANTNNTTQASQPLSAEVTAMAKPKVAPATELKIVVAQPLKQRQQLADEVVLASIYPVVLSLPLQALLIWLAVSKGLSPLLKFAEQLSGKKADDLTPVTLTEVPQELSQVLGTTNQLLAKLSDAFAREKRFASDVAHELRTPLSVLQVNLHNARSQWQQAGVADPAGLMPALEDGVKRMSQLIEQIMLLNRTNPEHFKAKLQQFDLVGLGREMIAELYPEILRKNQLVELESDDKLLVSADAFAIRLLLLNLLGNAIKYTPADGQILLGLSAQLNQVIISVEDSGPGIDPTEYQRVFDRFYRVGGDRHQSGEPGSGLGLSIVKEIVALHSGKLQLGPSRFSTGLKITVELPQ